MRSTLILLLAGLCLLLSVPGAQAAVRDRPIVPPVLDGDGGIVVPPDHPPAGSPVDWLRGLSLAASIRLRSMRIMLLKMGTIMNMV